MNDGHLDHEARVHTGGDDDRAVGGLSSRRDRGTDGECRALAVASNLAKAVTGHQHLRPLAHGESAGDSHHQAPVENHARLERGVHHDVPLNFGKRHQINFGP